MPYAICGGLRPFEAISPSYDGADGRTRTGKGIAPQQILSLLCLPFHHIGAGTDTWSVAEPLSGSIAEKLAVVEETFKLQGGVFGRVGGMDDIRHLIIAEITTDGSLWSSL